ncbi:MAG: hypothetical protein ACRDY0_02170 [Acidimicrobiales bacterium]
MSWIVLLIGASLLLAMSNRKASAPRHGLTLLVVAVIVATEALSLHAT